MREIKLRAWDKEKKIMRNAIFVGLGNTYSMTKRFKPAKKLENVILMQNTGLKDKNGVEIYEGDIIEFTHCTGYNEYDINREIVEFDNGCFTSSWAFENNYCDECEVVGNIYDNPELLNLNN